MTSYCRASSLSVDSHLIGGIESRMKDMVKLDPPATIVVTSHSTLSGVSMVAPTVRVTNAPGFLHEILLLTVNMSGFGHHLLSGGTTALKGVKTVITKKTYLDV